MKSGVHIAEYTILGMRPELRKRYRASWNLDWKSSKIYKKRFSDKKINRLIKVNWEQCKIKEIQKNVNFLNQVAVDE